WGKRKFALAHNGNLTHLPQLAALLGNRPMETTMDSEYIVRLIESRDSGDLAEDLAWVFSKLRGSFSLGILFPECLVAACDPQGNRPLLIGRKDEIWVISSETPGFSGVGAQYVR